MVINVGVLTHVPNIVAGMVQDVKFFRSANFGKRPKNEISLIVIHNISLPPKKFGTSCIERFFLNSLPVDAHPYFKEIEQLRVSAHFCIKRDGSLLQFVSCLDRAWHAGVSLYHGRDKCNDFSIGIELEGADDIVYTMEQYETLAFLTVALQQHYPQIKGNITGHCNIAPERKSDPGSSFDWKLYLNLITQKGGTVINCDHL